MDVIRGVALAGILLVNIEGMVGPLTESLYGLNQQLGGADQVADAVLYIVAQGKFYTLFSLLFGMGFSILMTRAQAAGRPFFRLYLRRVFVLALFGLVHGLLIWSGDILLPYAFFGLLLLLFFQRTPQSRLPKWGLFFYLAPVAFVVLMNLLGEIAKLHPEARQEFSNALALERNSMAESADAQRLAYGSGNYADAVIQAASDLRMLWTFWIYMGWQLLGLFLFGAWFVHSGAIAQPGNYPRLFLLLRWLALPLGTIMMLYSYRLVPTNDLSEMNLKVGAANVLLMIGSLMMSMGYMAWIIRGLYFRTTARVLRLFAPAGRMALTNYLLQSLVGVLIFYNWGFGFYEQLGRAGQVLYVVALFGMQVVISRWWLQRFRFGPAEWLWRTLTYLRFP